MVRIRIFDDLGVTVFHTAGELTLDAVLRSLDEAYGDGRPPKDAVWDLRSSDYSAVTAEDFEAIVARLSVLSAGRAGGRTAFVCRGELDATLLQMLVAIAEVEDVPIAMRVFLDADEALRWLGLPGRALEDAEGM